VTLDALRTQARGNPAFNPKATLTQGNPNDLESATAMGAAAQKVLGQNAGKPPVPTNTLTAPPKLKAHHPGNVFGDTTDLKTAVKTPAPAAAPKLDLPQGETNPGVKPKI
jgi:hypothetical protein